MFMLKSNRRAKKKKDYKEKEHKDYYKPSEFNYDDDPRNKNEDYDEEYYEGIEDDWDDEDSDYQ